VVHRGAGADNKGLFSQGLAVKKVWREDSEGCLGNSRNNVKKHQTMNRGEARFKSRHACSP